MLRILDGWPVVGESVSPPPALPIPLSPHLSTALRRTPIPFLWRAIPKEGIPNLHAANHNSVGRGTS
ncbi:MAG: hypothetical protein ACM37W_05595 [Actinomycetota bacterium]